VAKRSYVASGGYDDGALAVLFLASIGAGVVTGAVLGFIAQWFSLFILFPLLMGGAAGAATAALVASRHVRAPLFALLAGLSGGTAAYASSMLVQYQIFRSDVLTTLSEPVDATDDDDPDEVQAWNALPADEKLEQTLARETGSKGIIGWYLYSAQQGTEVKRHSSQGIKFEGMGYYGLTIFELLLAAVAGGYVAWAQAKKPFCEACKTWYSVEEVVHSGSGEKEAVASTVTTVERGEMARAINESGAPSEKRVLLFHVERCGQCQGSDPILTLKCVVNPGTNKPKVSEKYVSLITQSELAELASSASKALATSSASSPNAMMPSS
jgi:hypothetical protein